VSDTCRRPSQCVPGKREGRIKPRRPHRRRSCLPPEPLRLTPPAIVVPHLAATFATPVTVGVGHLARGRNVRRSARRTIRRGRVLRRRFERAAPVVHSASNRSCTAARIEIGRPPGTVNRTVPPVPARTTMLHPLGTACTDSSANGNPIRVMTSRTSNSTSVVFTDRVQSADRRSLAYASLTFSPRGPFGPWPRSKVTA
jgi:hypothetical protein